jgi:PAS domain-containing protein
LPQIVWTARSDRQWDYANERWYDFVGAGGSHTNAPGWNTILHPDDLAPAYDTWRSAVGEGTPYQVECRLLDRKTGIYHWHLARAVPALDDYQNVVK